MRYFVVAFTLLVVLVVGVAGFRGGFSRKPPIEVFPDMDRQLKVRPQAASEFFLDRRGSRMPVAGTVARGTPFQDIPLNTGFVPGTTNWVATNPLPITSERLARGRERFQINCLPCHGPLADGNGITRKFGMTTIANLHDPRIVQMTDGEIFGIVTKGKGLMSSYADQIAEADRWAILAYVRALQRSRLGVVDEVPDAARAGLLTQMERRPATNR
jgi:mono/diheme cytochrome c family protein